MKQRQAGIPQMQLRQWYADGFVQDSFQLTHTTTIEMGLRYEYMDPLVDIRYTNSNLTFQNGVPSVFHRRAERLSQGIEISQPSQPRAAVRYLAGNSQPRLGASRRLRHVLHAG